MEILFTLIGIIYILSPIPLLANLIKARNKASHSEDLEKENEQLRRKVKYLTELNDEQSKKIEWFNKELNHNIKTNESGLISNEGIIPEVVSVDKIDTQTVSYPTNITASTSTSNNTSTSKSTKPQQTTVKVSEHKKNLLDLIDASNTGLILTVGVVLLLLASVGFMSATWGLLTPGIRALMLLSLSGIFIGAGILAKVKFNLPSTALAFYSIGSAALPVTIIGSSAFGLLGGLLTMSGTSGHVTFALAFLSLFILTLWGTYFFKSKVFALISLFCTTGLLLSLVTISGISETVVSGLIALVALLITFAAPILKRNLIETGWNPYSKVLDLFSIINQYILSVAMIYLSYGNQLSGLFIMLLGLGFLVGSFGYFKNALISIPHFLLIILGSAQLFQIESAMSVSIWFILTGIYMVGMSFLPIIRKPLNKVASVAGFIFISSSVIPISIHTLEHNNSLIFIPVLLTGGIIYLLYGYFKKNPHLSCGAICFYELLLLFGALRIFNMDIDSFFTCFMLIGTFLMYLIYILIKHPMYSVSGDALFWTFTLCSVFFFNNVYYNESFAFCSISTILMAIFTYINSRLVDRRTASYKDYLSVFYRAIWSTLPLIGLTNLIDYSTDGLIATSFLLIFTLGISSLTIWMNIKSRLSFDRVLYYSSYVMMFVYSLLIIPTINDYDCSNISRVLRMIGIFIPVITTLIILLISIRRTTLANKSNIFPSHSFMFSVGAMLLLMSYFICDDCSLTNQMLLWQSLTTGFVIISLLFILLRKWISKTSDSYIMDNLMGTLNGVLIWCGIYELALFITSINSINNVIVWFFIGICVLNILIFRHELRLVGISSFIPLTLYYIYIINLLNPGKYADYPLSSIHLTYLVYVIPVLVFSVFIALNKHQKLTKDSIFWGTLLMATSISAYDYKASALCLIGYIIIIIAYLIKAEDKESKVRALCILCVTILSSIWLKFPINNSEYVMVEKYQLHLIPTTVFMFLAPWIITKLNKYKATFSKIRLIYSYIAMAILGIMALDSNKLFDLITFAVISTLIIVVAYLLHNRNYIILGAICTLGFLIYLINEVVGGMAWLVYLTLAGLILIGVAVRNEIKRRNNQT